MSSGKRSLKTAKKLRKRIKRLGISYDMAATDDWDGFLSAFAEDRREARKEYTVGMAGNNCRLRRRMRRAFRRACCFSKRLFNHWKVFDMAFFEGYHTLWSAFSFFMSQCVLTKMFDFVILIQQYGRLTQRESVTFTR
ncbi:MAG: hypothetical protein LBF60_08300 [Treponema sp.]|nr:hypothetical protein [Treponema sp.]